MVQLPFLISADMKQAESQEDDVSIEGMRILLAEDNELNMEIAEFLLTNAGAEIIRASNGKEAVEAFAKSGVGPPPMQVSETSGLCKTVSKLFTSSVTKTSTAVSSPASAPAKPCQWT